MKTEIILPKLREKGQAFLLASRALLPMSMRGQRVEAKLTAAVWLILSVPLIASQWTSDPEILKLLVTRPHLQAAIEKIRNTNTRLTGIAELIRLAGPRLYQGSVVFENGDRTLFQLQGEAAKAVRRCQDIATVAGALDSADP